MCSDRDDLLSRYKWFSEQCCLINKAFSAVRPDIDRAFSGDAHAAENLFLFNDLQLFLMQVFAFDGFITACLHALDLSKEDSLTQRVQRLATCELKQDKSYQALLSTVDEIAKVRDAWVHAQGDPAILKNPQWPPHLTDRFGLCDRDGRLWVQLSHQAKDGREVWTFVVCTLQQMAELIWPRVQARMQRLEEPAA